MWNAVSSSKSSLWVYALARVGAFGRAELIHDVEVRCDPAARHRLGQPVEVRLEFKLR